MFRTASFGQRVAGSLIDGVVILALSGMVYVAGFRPYVWLSGGVSALYLIVLTATAGQTVGKRIVGIRVVVDDAPTTAPPPPAACIIRWAVLAVPGFAPGSYGSAFGLVVTLVALYGIANEERARGIHDNLAQTRVIEAR